MSGAGSFSSERQVGRGRRKTVSCPLQRRAVNVPPKVGLRVAEAQNFGRPTEKRYCGPTLAVGAMLSVYKAILADQVHCLGSSTMALQRRVVLMRVDR